MLHTDGISRRTFSKIEKVYLALLEHVEIERAKKKRALYIILTSSFSVSYKKLSGELTFKANYNPDKKMSPKQYDKKLEVIQVHIDERLAYLEEHTNELIEKVDIDMKELFSLPKNQIPKEIVEHYMLVLSDMLQDYYKVDHHKTKNNMMSIFSPKMETAKMGVDKIQIAENNKQGVDSRKLKGNIEFIQSVSKHIPQYRFVLKDITSINKWADLYPQRLGWDSRRKGSMMADRLKKELLWVGLLTYYFDHQEEDTHKDYIFRSKNWISNADYVSLLCEETDREEAIRKATCTNIMQNLPHVWNKLSQGRTWDEALQDAIDKKSSDVFEEEDLQ